MVINGIATVIEPINKWHINIYLFDSKIISQDLTFAPQIQKVDFKNCFTLII